MKKRFVRASLCSACLSLFCVCFLVTQGCTPSHEPSAQWSSTRTMPANASAATGTTKSLVPGSREAKPQSAVPVEEKTGKQLSVGTDTLVFGSEPVPDSKGYTQLQVSAEKGDANAQYRLAVYQCRVKRDGGAMLEWLRKAAAQNHAKAQVALGNCYLYAVGVSKDATEAVTWYRRAAERGYAPGQSNLGVMYAEGEGVPRDYQEAMKWCRKAAEQGNAGGQFNLGVMYAEGEGVPQDYQEAVRWYRKAAEQGDAVGQLMLAKKYGSGQGVPIDAAEAYKWVIVATTKGHGHTKELEEEGLYSHAEELKSYLYLILAMTPGKIEETQQRAKEFLNQRERGSAQGNER